MWKYACHFVVCEELLTWIAAAMSSTENIWDGAETQDREKAVNVQYVIQF